MSDYRCTICGAEAGVTLRDGPICPEHYEAAKAWKKAVEDQALAEMGGPIPQRCPRRDEGFGHAVPADQTPDEWRFGHGVITDELVLTCNYCGSLHPDVFMQKLREGWIAGPTDKNYKAYLSKPYSDEEKAQRRQQWLASGMAKRLVDGTKDHHPETTDDEMQALLERHYDEQIAPTSQGSSEAKFYFQHLSDDQKREFVQMLNDRHMRIGYPGHFYRRPFFVTVPS